MSNNFRFQIKEIADLKEVIKCVKESGKKIVILSGTLGSGKTTFAKSFAKINDFYFINADEIAKKMQEKYESMKSMEADVLITMNIMGQTKTMQYKYAFEKPNKFYMENDEFLMVCDGKTYYTYNKKTNQYTMMEIKGEENDIFSPDYGKFIKSMLKNFNVSYLGEENYDGRKCYVLELIPKENPEEKMKMYVDEEYWQPLKIEMEGMSIEYKNVKFNVDIPDERFKFTPPEGAKLMSSGKMTMSKDIDEVQKDVSFKILVPKYTAGLELQNAMLQSKMPMERIWRLLAYFMGREKS